MFRILAPFVDVRQVDPLKNAGADELFCGFVDEESERRWPSIYATINRRCRGASFEGYPAFTRAVNRARQRGLPVYVTMNGLYTPEQYPWVLKTIGRISQMAGVKGIIVADLGLLLELRRLKYAKQVHLSTGGSVFNPLSVEFFLSLGVSRVVLDRQLTVEEMSQVIADNGNRVCFELFIIRSSCPFIDSYCTFLHTCGIARQTPLDANRTIVHASKPVPLGCVYVNSLLDHRRFQAFSIDGKRMRYRHRFDRINAQLKGCNLCALPALHALRLKYPVVLKVLERGLQVTRLVRIVRQAADLVEAGALDRQQYRQRAKNLFTRFYGVPCNEMNCYCPPSLCRQAL